jgi:short-subunit dehydrogenase
MGTKLKRLKDQVLVITGASSGIGLTTAEMAVERGARVVMAARSQEELKETAERLNRRGRRASFIEADVADEHAVERIADHAVDEFGGFDTWVNNAGISIYGRLTDVPMTDKRRVFETNFWGTVYGCKAAVKHLRRHGGTIINIGSVVSEFSIPLQGIYSASKLAVKGYTDALRMELEEAGLPIWVTLMKPEQTPPVYPPEEVANAILRCAERPVREVFVGGGGRLQAAMSRVAPRLTDIYRDKTAVASQQMMDEQARGSQRTISDDALWKASQDRRRRGGYPGRVMRSSLYTRAVLSDAARATPFVALGLLVATGVAAARR